MRKKRYTVRATIDVISQCQGDAYMRCVHRYRYRYMISLVSRSFKSVWWNFPNVIRKPFRADNRS